MRTLFGADLLRQIKQKKNSEVLSTLQKTPNFSDAIGVSGKSLLHYAAKFGNDTVVKFLIKSGSQINLQNKDGDTPLLLATRRQHKTTIKILLEFDADYYICDNNGVSPLQAALQGNPTNLEIVKLFLQQVSYDGWNNEDIAERLIRMKCPFYTAVLLENLSVTTCILTKGCSINEKDPMTGKNALHIVVENLDPDYVEKLIFFGADINAKDASGKTPLAMLTDFKDSTKSLRILKALIKANADWSLCDNEGFMQIRYILENGPFKIVTLVLKSLIDVDVTDQHMQNIVHYLAKNCNPSVFKAIENTKILTKIHVNACDKNGMTALHLAINIGNVNFVEYIVKKDANMHISNSKGVSPFLQAIESEADVKNRLRCIEILLENGAHPGILMSQYFNTYNTKSVINRDLELLKPVIAMLVLEIVKDKPTDRTISNKICANYKLRQYFDSCMYELMNMTMCKVYEDVTVFDILVQNEKCRSFENSVIFLLRCSQIIKRTDKFQTISMYTEILKNRIHEIKCIKYDDMLERYQGALVGIGTFAATIGIIFMFKESVKNPSPPSVPLSLLHKIISHAPPEIPMSLIEKILTSTCV